MNFNYHSNNELLLEDNNFVNTGYSIEDFNRITKFKPEHTIKNRMKNISALYLYKQFNQPVNKYFDITYSNNCIVINSNLKNDQHDYYYAKSAIPLKELGLKSNTSQDVYLDTDVGLNIQLIFKYLDSNLVNISHSMILATKNQKIDIPSNCQYVLIGIRIYGHGQTKVNYLMLGHKIIDPAFVISNKSCLLVTNHYPSYSDLYRNAFVHSRVAAYQDQGLIVDVFRLRVNESVSYHEFEGVDVVTGSNDALEKMIENNNFKVIMVHFLDESMWSSLSKYTDTHKVIVWVHGAEIQAWHRRAFNHSNQREIDKAKSLYEKRAKFWSKILKNIPKNLHLIFVSKYFADEVMNDLQLEIPENQYSIIPNPIDTNMFSNVSKDVELRKKILTIRPFASKTYANDLTVKIIMELIKEPFFSELEFRIVGDGPLFEETIEPLVSLQLDNIIIERKFLTHNEIAMLHKEYGIFLCPSRMDTQGVSRDEAMASGLVPITNAVGAIPEFLKEFEELTLPPEDYIAMAEKIKDLYYNPDKFGFLSKRVSASIKSRSSGKIIIKEIEIIKR
jgi:glycosyltransferase involved in cell wall biosynthesis